MQKRQRKRWKSVKSTKITISEDERCDPEQDLILYLTSTVKPREGTMNNFVPSRNRWNQDYLASAFHHWLDEQTLRNMSKKLESSWKHWSSDAGHDIGRTAGQVKTVRTVQAGQMWMRKTMSVLSGWPLTAQIWLHNLVRAENFMPVVLYAAKTYFKLCPF